LYEIFCFFSLLPNCLDKPDLASGALFLGEESVYIDDVTDEHLNPLPVSLFLTVLYLFFIIIQLFEKVKWDCRRVNILHHDDGMLLE